MKKNQKIILPICFISFLTLASCGVTANVHIHSYGAWMKDKTPTFTSSGSLVRTCKEDTTHTQKYVLPPLDDSKYDVEIVKNPTCEETGIKTYSFKIDDQTFTYEIELEKTFHTYSDIWSFNDGSKKCKKTSRNMQEFRRLMLETGTSSILKVTWLNLK